MEDMTLEQQIFYFKEGVQGDVENERSIAIGIIDRLQSENERLKAQVDMLKLDKIFPTRDKVMSNRRHKTKSIKLGLLNEIYFSIKDLVDRAIQSIEQGRV